MPTLLYIHGFLSSPQSHKALLTEQWLPAHHPEIRYLCPYLSPYPLETERQLREIMAELDGEQVGLIGSSLGGFWSTWLVENYDNCRAVLINPSVRPFALVDRVAGEPQRNYHNDDVYVMTAEHGEQFRRVYPQQLKHLDRYYLLAQTGDETLDYRHAAERFAGCRQTIEEGGDHGFQGYQSHLPDIIEFLFS
ncbi:esterase YqiA [Pseudomaricurvus alkylphenolicus]|uniref:YqiA/YcfP family alpha/beta fold hydrolase n=1 Tax=Pseudomaricurvus alkylphenolicus TaxID=1306991 RepID=UPI00141ED9C5|nr:YqiA/YcfP family alpha/beta fold hydrolase [Pseudomaricurvus alkylphenolicus]NIB42881.1 esterase YqiA [Pseudomaricurvus alkylphenolicus]